MKGLRACLPDGDPYVWSCPPSLRAVVRPAERAAGRFRARATWWRRRWRPLQLHWPSPWHLSLAHPWKST